MDWRLIKRRMTHENLPTGVWVSLEDLVRMRFRAREINLSNHQPSQSVLAGRHASRLRGRGLNFEELRRYQPGDDTRTIDWKVTARTRIPHVRVYSEEKDRSVILLVDQRMNMFFGTKERMKSVTAAKLAALFTWSAIGAGDRVGMIIFNDKDVVNHKPQRSESSVLSAFGTLVEMNHQLNVKNPIVERESQLNIALNELQRNVTHDSLIICISDFFGIDEQTEKLTASLAQHNDVLACLIHDPMRMKMQRTPFKVTVSNGLEQMIINLGQSNEREKILKHYREQHLNINQFLQKISAPMFMVSNEGDVVEQMHRLLGSL